MKAVADFIDQVEKEAGKTPRPLVTLSFAQSLDGSIARRSGFPIAISSPKTLKVTHFLRSIHDGILVGIGTIMSDDPRLTVREVEGSDPQPIILDPFVQTPLEARILEHPKPPWIFDDSKAKVRKSTHLSSLGVRSFRVHRAGNFQYLNLPNALNIMKEEGIQRLMVEGGARVIESFITAGLVDVIVITIAPALIGGLKYLNSVQEESGLIADFPHIENPQVEVVGNDILLWGKVVKKNS